MLDLPIGPFFSSYHQLAVTSQIFAAHVGQPSGIQFGDADYQKLLSDAVIFIISCEAMQLSVSIGAAKRVRDELRSATQQGTDWNFDQRLVGRCSGALVQLHGCLRHETDLKVAMILPSDLATYFSPQGPLFGLDVSVKFPSLTAEIDEAGKCLALGRSTASVFHLMRTLEGALNAVHLCLGLTKPNNPNWGVVLAGISSQIAARGRNWSEVDFFREAHAQFDIIRQAWRNSTMHVENVYTEREARILVDATAGLLQKLAGRMDEHGLPLA